MLILVLTSSALVTPISIEYVVVVVFDPKHSPLPRLSLVIEVEKVESRLENRSIITSLFMLRYVMDQVLT